MNKYILLLAITSLSYNLQAQNISEKNFTAQAENAKSNFSQNLSVKWISDNAIAYTLKYTNGDCSKNISGKAILKKKNDTTIISTLKGGGESFPVDQYIDSEKKGINVLLKIDTANKNKAVVEFITKNDIDIRDDCNPGQNVMASK